MGKFIGRVCLLLIILIIGAGITGCVTGEIHYVETYRAPGESRGYIVRRAKHLDSEENFVAVFDELASLPAFEGEEVVFMRLNVMETMITADIQLPENRTYVDSYRYNPQSFNPEWEKGDSVKSYNLDEDSGLGCMDGSISLSDLKVEWIYYLYEDMVAYIADSDFQREEDSSIGISLSLETNYFEEDLIPYTPPQLRGSATGVREDWYTKVDLTTSQY